MDLKYACVAALIEVQSKSVARNSGSAYFQRSQISAHPVKHKYHPARIAASSSAIYSASDTTVLLVFVKLSIDLTQSAEKHSTGIRSQTGAFRIVESALTR